MFFGLPKVLSADWLKKLESIDIEYANAIEQRMSEAIMQHIVSEGKNAVVSRVVQEFLHSVFGKQDFFLPGFETLPLSLVDEVAKELESDRSKGINRQRKLNSSMVELSSYSKLNTQYGYTLVDFEREDGSCDFSVKSEDKILHFEVKFKMDDRSADRLVEYMMYGMAMLPENDWMQGNTYWVTLYKNGSIGDKELSNIEEDLFRYFEQNNHTEFVTENIRIFQSQGNAMGNKVVTIYCDATGSDVFCPEVESIEKLIGSLMLSEGGKSKPLDKMYKKNLRIEDFNGFLIWDIPMSWSQNENCNLIANIKEALLNQIKLKRKTLPFDLYVWVRGFKIDEMLCLKID